LAQNQLSQTIIQLMHRRRMKQIELSRAADVDSSQLSRILQGRAFPSIDSLGRIADALGVSPGSLLDGETPRIEENTPEIELDPTLTVSLRALQQLDDDDKEQVIAVIQQVLSMVDRFKTAERSA
jgi:transcriptional regulator with XRE-family HTH domain